MFQKSTKVSDDKKVNLLDNESANLKGNEPSEELQNHPRYDPVPRFISAYYICWYTIVFGLSLFGLVYDPSLELYDNNGATVCGDEFNSFLIPLDVWLNVNCIPMLISSIAFLSGYCFLRFCSTLSLFDRVQRILWSSITTAAHCILSLFYTIWSILGFYMFANQMTDDCQASDIGTIVLLLSIFQLFNLCSFCCCASVVKCFGTMKCIRWCMYYSKRSEGFRITKKQIIDVFPECVDEEYLKAHPYINVINLDKMPSIKFREMDLACQAGKNKKVEQLSGPIENHPTIKDALKEQRFGSYIFSIGFVAQPSLRHNTIVDNIYLNEDIRFAVIAHENASIDKGVILYTHGGGYVVGSHRDPLQMLSMLSELIGCVAISIDYKLCPEYPLPRCLNDSLAVYKWLCDVNGVRTRNPNSVSSHCPDWVMNVDANELHKRCVFAGDSAGGGLCLLLLQAVNADNSVQLPCCAWPISPWTKLTGLIGKRDNKGLDAMLFDPYPDPNNKPMEKLAHILVGNFDIENEKLVKNKGDANYCDVDDAKVSPFDGDVKGLCPLYMSVGASEMLLDDTLMFAEKAYNEGVEVEVEVEPYLCHVYPTFVSIFPEAKEAVIRASEFIKRQLQKQK